jgi:hypothetical protein
MASERLHARPAKGATALLLDTGDFTRPSVRLALADEGLAQGLFAALQPERAERAPS